MPQQCCQHWRYLAAKVNKALRVIISVAAVLKKLEISRPYQRLATPALTQRKWSKIIPTDYFRDRKFYKVLTRSLSFFRPLQPKSLAAIQQANLAIKTNRCF